MWFRFEVDQLASKNGKLMVVRGDRHLLVGGLPAMDLTKLTQAYAKHDFIASGELSPEALTILVNGSILAPADVTALSAHKAARGAERRQLSYVLAYPLRYMGSAAGLIIMGLISLLLYQHSHQAFKVLSIAALVQTAPAMQIALAVFTLLLTTAVHELGHATAACYYTGTVGRVHFRLIWGIPAMTVDVTSHCLANRTGKICISLAGAIFQLLISFCILASTDISGIQAGACLGIFLALFNLLPLPFYDGYWVLVDLIGRKFRPRLLNTQDILEIVYGLALMILFINTVPSALRAIFSQYMQSTSMMDNSPVRSIVLFVFCAFSMMSVLMFSYSLFKNLLGARTSDQTS